MDIFNLGFIREKEFLQMLMKQVEVKDYKIGTDCMKEVVAMSWVEGYLFAVENNSFHIHHTQAHHRVKFLLHALAQSFLRNRFPEIASSLMFLRFHSLHKSPTHSECYI